MTNISEIKNGMAFIYKSNLYLMIDSSHKKVARGKAVIKTKLRNLYTGKIILITFTNKDKVENAFIETKNTQYLYEKNDKYCFMDLETFEEVSIEKSKIKWESNFLKSGVEIEAEYYSHQFISIKLPEKIVLKIISTQDGASKGNTVGGASKNAILETGYKLQVPLFIKNEEEIIISTINGKYVSRSNDK